ncbi:putative phage abortive infection protein [Pseudomonas sp. PA1(2017)]|uniref:putative phage abortive infection protein n=1 Tax=Pseudomonas sp. PA1(2017) TaxID=1932113 RepID=UPI0009F9C216|nr:putative phage abortive infection protein [Pseudomonas sp. PA1(2017)]
MSNRLAYQFRKKLLKERLSRFFKYKILTIKESLSKINFTLTTSLVSAVLITAVCATFYYNFFLSDEPLPIPHKENLEYWGQIGDFIGGILNPLLSFLALMAVLHTIKTQRNELKEAREEAKLANTIQNKQTDVFERQNFESALFRLFDVHSKITDRILNTKKSENTFQSLAWNFNYHLEQLDQKRTQEIESGDSTRFFIWRYNEFDKISEAAETSLSEQTKDALSHYFRNIYQILKMIDEHQYNAINTSNKLRDEYSFKRRYSSMFRALLTGEELTVIAINCFTQQGTGLKKYIEKYSILKHIDKHDSLKERPLALEFFNEIAFMDSEKISNAQIIRYNFNKDINRATKI